MDHLTEQLVAISDFLDELLRRNVITTAQFYAIMGAVTAILKDQ